MAFFVQKFNRSVWVGFHYSAVGLEHDDGGVLQFVEGVGALAVVSEHALVEELVCFEVEGVLDALPVGNVAELLVLVVDHVAFVGLLAGDEVAVGLDAHTLGGVELVLELVAVVEVDVDQILHALGVDDLLGLVLRPQQFDCDFVLLVDLNREVVQRARDVRLVRTVGVRIGVGVGIRWIGVRIGVG